MKKYFLVLLTVLAAFITNNAFATHAAGGELIYEHLPTAPINQYKFTLKFYRDCTGSTAASPTNNVGSTIQMCYSNTCGQTTPLQTTLTQGALGVNVSNGCANFQTQCTNATSFIPGFIECIYTGVVTLPTQCNKWKFWVDISARNGAITNLQNPGSQDLYIETTFDNTGTFQGNSSPIFTNAPISWTGLSPANINFGAFDPNGDSLTYATINPRTGSGCSTTPATPILYVGAPTINPLNPFPCSNTFFVNPTLGQITFTPSATGLVVITIEVTEWRNGVQIGTIVRDLQISIINSTVANPSVALNSGTIFGGNYNSTNGTIYMCATDSVHFCVNMTSPNAGAILNAIDNHAIVTPGATMTYTGLGTNAVTGCFDWTPSGSDTGLHVLTVTVKDSTCNAASPIILSSTIAIPIFIYPVTKAFRDTAICLGDTVHLTCYGGTQFTWSVLSGGSPISSLTSLTTDNDTVWVQPTVTTSYVVTSNLSSVCNHFTDTVTITVAAGPTLTITPDYTTCINATSQLNVTASPNNQAYSYSWVPSTYLNNPNVSNPLVVNPQQDISYTVTVVPQGVLACSSQATVNVTVLKGFDILNILNGDTSICIGENILINGIGSPIYNYNWTPPTYVSNPSTLSPTITPTASGTFNYTVTASFPGCPDSIQTKKITVQDLPTVNAGLDREICAGDTVLLDASYGPLDGTTTILWSPSADLSNDTIPDPFFDGVGAVNNLILTATSNIGCKTVDSVLIQVVPSNYLDVKGNKTLCPNETTTLSVTGGLEYKWSPVAYVSDSTASNITVNPTTTTTFSVIAKDIKGCIDTGYATVVINPGGLLDAGDDKTIYPGESVELYADGNCSKFNWFPPNGLSAIDIKNPIASPSVTTKYIVHGETENGCKVIDSVKVIVSPESLLDIPNAFSPGSGTSINDELKIIIRGIVTLNEFSIYNRWGQQVFTTKDIKKGWNGRFSGKPQPLGTYVYYIDAVTSTGKKFIKQGNVTLFR